MIDLDAAQGFMATHARLLDRRRFDVLLHGAGHDCARAALGAYRNPDGGYGWGLEPDLRDTTSQPGAAVHAFGVFEDIAPSTSPRSAELCDWLASAALPDGGLPFAPPVRRRAGCAPFWANADPTVSSLQLTAVVTTVAHRVAAHDPRVAEHPWLARSTAFCLAAIEALGDAPHALELAFALQFLDAVHDTRPEAGDLIARLGRDIPADGLVHVGGRPRGRDAAPARLRPGARPPRAAAVRAGGGRRELARLARAGQRHDGGWTVDFASYSPAAALEWRGP